MLPKKIIIHFFALLTIAAVQSCSKDTSITPAPTPVATEDILASDNNAQLGDVEVDIYNKRILWQSITDHKLWVCDIDPSTGKLAVGDGRQTLVDSDIIPLTTSFNSGEWAFSQQGTAIVYGKKVSSTFYIAIASQSGNSWVLNSITSSPNRFNPRATKNPLDAVGAVQYPTYPGTSATKYKFLNNLATEYSVSNFSDTHWAEDEQLLTGILPNNQVGLFNPANAAAPIQITNNPANIYSRPYMWRAPELGNARMFFAKVNGNKMEVYKETGNGTNAYVLYNQFNYPSATYANIASPEPVIFKSKSYISFMTAESPLETSGKPADIWIAYVGATIPTFTKVSENTVKVRTDPEPYVDIANNQLYIYYTEVDDSAAPDFAIDPTTILKLRRCKTGL
jgi:hypothetical protein